MNHNRILKLNSLFLIFCILITVITSVPFVTANAATVELDYYTAADFTTTSTNYISRTPVELDRSPSGEAYVYTASDAESGWFNYGFKGINNLDNKAEAVAFWVGQDKTQDNKYLSANYKLNFIGISLEREEEYADFYFIPTDGGEICTSRSKYIYSLFDSDRKHGDFVEGFVVIPLSMYKTSTKKAISEKENLEIHITTNVNKSYVAADGTVTNGSITKAQNHYISSLGFVSDLDGFLAQFLDGYSADSIYSEYESNSIYNGLTADMYLHFKNKESTVFDKDIDFNNKLSRIKGIEALWNRNATFSYSPFYNISAQDLKNGKINSDFKIGARKNKALNGLTRETISGFEAPEITFAKGGLLLEWQMQANSDRYEVNVFDSNGKQVKNVTSSTNSVILTGLEFDNTYTFQIDAYDSINYLGSSVCRSYEYVAHSIFDGSITDGFGGNTSQDTVYEASPTGKAVMLGGSGTVWQKSYLKSDKPIEAVAVWVAQSGVEVAGKTYYEQRMIAININGNTIYGNSAGSGTAVNYIVPTFGDTAFAVTSSKKLAIDKLKQPLTDNAGCYYVFPLDLLSADERDYINNLLKNGQELRVSTIFGTNVSYFSAGSSSYVTDSNLISQISALENNYYHSNVLLISNLEKCLYNNGITAVKTVSSATNTGDTYNSAEKNAASFTDYADCSFVGSIEQSGKVTASFSDETGLTDTEYTVTLPKANNAKNCGTIEAQLSENGGISLMFTASKTGMYYLSSTLDLVSGNTAKWRTVVDSSGKKVHKKGTVYNGVSASFGKGIYMLKAGDRLLMEVYSDNTACVKLSAPLITMIPISVMSGKISYSYYYNAFNLSAIYGFNTYKTEYAVGKTNPWAAYAIDENSVKHNLNILGVTDSTDNANVITSAESDVAFVQPSVYTDGEYISNAVIKPSGVISFEFTSPSTGSLVLGGIKTENGISYCTVLNGKADSFKECNSGELKIEIPNAKTGDKIELRVKNNLSATAYIPTDLYARLTVNQIIYGDTNADGLFTLKDLVHTKKYYSGAITDLNNSGAIGNYADENYAQLLAFMRKALLDGSNIEDFVLKSE